MHKVKYGPLPIENQTRFIPIYIKIDLITPLKTGNTIALSKMGYVYDDYVKRRITGLHLFISAN